MEESVVGIKSMVIVGKLKSAIEEYLRRQSGMSKPKAHWNAQFARFDIDPEEAQECCWAISPAMRFSHCRSIKHVAAMYGVDAKLLLLNVRAVRRGAPHA